jgi:ABC-type multidrug transport system fused ATPase/permease subunit
MPLDILDSLEGKNMLDDVRHAQSTIVYLTDRVIKVLSSIYSFVAAMVILVSFNLYVSILFIVFTLPGIILDAVFEQKAEIFRHKYAPDVRKFSYYRWMLTDPVTARDVRMYNLASPIKQRYNEEKNKYRRENIKFEIKKTQWKLVTEFIKRAGEVLFIAFVIIQYLNINITIGELTLYTGLVLTASNDVYNIVGLTTIILIRARSVSGCFNKFFGMSFVERFSVANNLSLNSIDSITFDNVFFKYPQTSNYVLSGVSFTIHKGEHISLIGINGSGKTTIVKLIIGLYQPTSGVIRINGRLYSEYDVSEIRRQFSVLFQNFIKYPLSIRSNVVLSDPDCTIDDDYVMKCLDQSGLKEKFVGGFKKGLDTIMTKTFDDDGVELSGGQWQSVALARAFYKNASVYIFDEPEASLDPLNEELMLCEIEKKMVNKTSIMITHRLVNTRHTNRIIVLNCGIIAEDGTHDELMRKNGLYANMYNIQKSKFKLEEIKHDVSN